MKIARILSKLNRFLISNFGSQEKKAAYLRRQGAKIGKNLVLNGDLGTFGTEPYLISVGDDCLLAAGVRLVTHDGGISVLNKLGKFNGRRADKVGRIEIGNNVYIGMSAMVMPGASVGDNTIIGAHALVSGNIPANSVAVGIPARVICSIDEYYEKCRKTVRFTAGMSAAEKRAFYENVNFVDLRPEEMDNEE